MNRPCLASPLPEAPWQLALANQTNEAHQTNQIASVPYQLLQHQQEGWRVLSLPLHASAMPAHSLQALADLMLYGIVGPLAELTPGNLLWLPIFPQLSETQVREMHLASLLTTTQLPAGTEQPSFTHALEWQAQMVADAMVADANVGAASSAPATQVDNLAHARILSGSRSLCSGIQLPLVDLRLLSTMFAATALPAGPLALVWPARTEITQGFLAQLQASQRQALLAQQEILRQRRRQALQLPVEIETAVLDRHIYQHLILPAAQYYLQLGSQAACANQRSDLYLVADIPSGCESLKLPYTQFSLHDPLGENLYALALRRLCFGKRRAQLRRQFKIAPRTLTRQVQALDLTQHDGAAQAVLAALQLDFLYSESI